MDKHSGSGSFAEAVSDIFGSALQKCVNSILAMCRNENWVS